MEVVHFRSAAELRRWLQKHHATATELWVGFYRKDSGKGGITYLEAVDQALCFGWIDGVRKRVDADRYTNRFTPRKAKSTWSQVNMRRVGELTRLGSMAPAGLAAFKARDRNRSGYSYENRPSSFLPDLEKTFKANKQAWAFFQSMPPGYRRTLIWWVISAVKDETRQKRLAMLIDDAAHGRRRGLVEPPGLKTSKKSGR